ncbi:MAG: AAA family ATPase [Planctomycetota bacterium]
MNDQDGARHPLTRAAVLAPALRAAESGLAPWSAESAPAPEAEEARGSRRAVTGRLLLSYKWSILAVFLLVAGPLLAAVWLLVVPEYEAEGVIQVRSVVPRLVWNTEETGPMPRYDQHLRSQVELIKRPEVLERVVARPDVQATAWFQEPASRRERWFGIRPDPVGRLTKAITAEPFPGTELIRVAAVAKRPGDAQVLSNAVLEEYETYANKYVSEEDQRLLKQVEQDKRAVQTEIQALEARVQFAQDDLKTRTPEELLNQRRVRLDEQEAALALLEAEIEVREQQMAALADAPGAAQDAADPALVAEARLASDALYQKYADKLEAAERDLQRALQQFGSKHPSVKLLQEAADKARQQVDERKNQLARLPRPAPAAALGSGGQPGLPTLTLPELQLEKRLLEIRRGHLEEYVGELRGTFAEAFDTAKDLENAQTELTKKRDMMAAVDRRLRELDEKHKLHATVSRLSKAPLPSEPNTDRRIRYSGAAILGGLALALALAVLRLSYSPQVQQLEEVRGSSRAAFLGHVPLGRRMGIAALERCPFQAESVRVIRTALLNRLDQTGQQVVQVSSATPGAGKSTFAFLLARSLAQCGKRVLLVDADLRRPALAERLAIEPAPGLLDLLHDGSAPLRGVRPTSIAGLSVLPAGDMQEVEDYELLADGAFVQVLQRWRKEFDIVLLDSAPMLGAADAAIVARNADGTVMVVRERHCRRTAVIEALALLSAAGGQLLGTVFIGSEGQGRYGYGYGYGYGYDRPRTRGNGELAQPMS